MNENTKIIVDYYSNYVEDERFRRDKAHGVEYLTTKKYIDKNLKLGDRILEVGAGTGAYSIYYASKGYKVDAVELSTNNLNILKSKITPDMDIRAIEGNALDLSMYNDNTFDITLVLGPLYHLFTEEEKKKAIKEAIRVTKSDGYIYIAYIANDAVFISYCLKKRHLLETDRLCDNNYKLKDIPEEVFSTHYISGFNKLMSNYNVEYITTVATDGLSSILSDYVNDLTDEEFKVWLDYHYSTCERSDLQGYSNHMLYIGKKGEL